MALLPLALLLPEPEQTPVFRVAVEAVRVDVFVGREGNAIAGLDREAGSDAEIDHRHLGGHPGQVLDAKDGSLGSRIREPRPIDVQLLAEKDLTKIPVYKDEIDNIVDMCALGELILSPDKPIKKNVTPANFVPEQKTIESLLEFFRNTSTDTAIVVDEYGGVAGMVSLEDCVEEILGPMDITEQVEPIEQIGPLTYRLSGNLAIHDWAEAFDIDLVHSRMTTIAGLTTALLGRVPKSGDTAHIKNLKLTVENLHKHRIQSIILTFEELKP